MSKSMKRASLYLYERRSELAAVNLRRFAAF